MLDFKSTEQSCTGEPYLRSILGESGYTTATGTVINSTRQPFGGNSGDNYSFETNTDSAYNSFQTSVRYASKRLPVFGGYTFSKSLDDTSNIQDKTPNPLNVKLSRGLSSFDITHNFVLSYDCEPGIFHGPCLKQFDMSLLKNLKLTERSSLQFRAEFFNVFNHAQFINQTET